MSVENPDFQEPRRNPPGDKQLAEKLIGKGKKCQGMASAVPQIAHSKSRDFST
jgi:hypothetical protein